MKQFSVRKTVLAAFCLLFALVTSFAVWSVFPAAEADAAMKEISGTDYFITSDTKYSISPDVTEHDLIMNTEAGARSLGYYMEIKGNSQHTILRASYGEYEPEKNGWKFESVLGQINKYQETYPDERVIAGVNSDIFNMGTGEPTGMLVMRGKVMHVNTRYAFFARFSDNSVGLFDAGTTLDAALTQQKAKVGNDDITLTDATGGFFMIAKGGKLTGSATNSDLAPRTTIGIKENGDIIVMCVDGRQAPVSVGMTTAELAHTMLSLGCQDVFNFDGGGSTTFRTQREGENGTTLRNLPSDGIERTVSSALLITSSAPAGGEFDHVNITPQNNYYTPGSQVELTALGADAYGYEVKTITEGTWKVKDGGEGSFGETSYSGNTATVTFTAPDEEGELTLQYLVGDVVKGETTLGFYHPDALAFASPSVNLDYNAVTNLGLSASKDMKEVILKAGDIQWTATGAAADGTDSGEDYADLGSGENKAGEFQGLEFHVTSDWHFSGKFYAHAAYAHLSEGGPEPASINVGIGMKPTVVLNGGDPDEQEVETAGQDGKHAIKYDEIGRLSLDGGNITNWDKGTKETVDLCTGHYMNNLGGGQYSSRNGNESAVRVTKSDPQYDDIIRFGNNAVRLNFDFTQTPTDKIEGATLGFSNDQLLTGSPTAIGVWVYAPEGTPNLWLRAAVGVQDKTNPDKYNYTYVNFTAPCSETLPADPHNYGGINWVGWKYVEADLSGYAGQYIKILAGETVRLMYATGTYKSGIYDRLGNDVPHDACKGYVIVDNLQFVYGTNTQDVTEPVIDSIEVASAKEGGRQGLTDGMILTENEFYFYVNASDTTLASPYNTGLLECIYFIDGLKWRDDAREEALSSAEFKTRTILPNGEHSLTVRVKDQNGNEAQKTVRFTVQGEGKMEGDGHQMVDIPRLSLEYGDTVHVGGTYQIKLLAHGDITGVTLYLTAGSSFTVTEQTAQGVTLQSSGDNTWQYKVTDLPEDGVIATYTLKLPENLVAGSRLAWSVRAAFDMDNVTERVSRTFSTPSVYVPVSESYHISAGDMIVGMGDGKIVVTDENGAPAAGVQVYLADSTLLGTTGEDGVLQYGEGKDNNVFTATKGTYTVYAVKDDAHSFYTPVTSYDPVTGEEDGDPAYYVIFNAVKDPVHQKSFSWMSYIKGMGSTPAANKVRYSKTDNFEDATEAEGKSVVYNYANTQNANYMHTILIENLDPDTTYYYWIGDGETWSKQPATFKTGKAFLEETNFFLVGDMQGEDAAMAKNFSQNLKDSGKEYSFAIQTGDAIDDPGNYNEWKGLLDVFSNDIFGETDLIHVIGNHETVSDMTALGARTMFGIDADGPACWFSYEYGDVYVATLGFTTEPDDLAAFSAWLKEDAAKSKAAWKIVTCHVPIWNTNTNQSESGTYRAAGLESTFEEAGIDFVFSGHDHTYARTKPLIQGEEAENGIVYYIVGTAGEKKYSITENDRFVMETQNYNAIYVAVTANKRHIKITAYDVQANGEQKEFDTYEIGPHECDLAAHTFEYDSATDRFFCTVCGKYFLKDRDEASLKLYTGLVDDVQTGKVRYLENGVFATGMRNVRVAGSSDSAWRYFDEDGLGFEGDYEVGGETLHFEDGMFVPTDEIVNAGLAGEKAYFILYASGKMYITGEGAMKDFNSENDRPWGTTNTITSIVIGKDITRIGVYSFRNTDNFVSSLTFEKGSKLESIGYESMRELGKDVKSGGDPKLGLVVLPESLKSIEQYVFRGIRVKMLVFPDGLQSCPSNAFLYAHSLKLNVLEGSEAEKLVKSYGLSYSTRRYLMADLLADSDVGVCVVEEADLSARTYYYFVDGELVQDSAGKRAALKACLDRYAQMTEAEKTAHAEDYAELLKLLSENKDAGFTYLMQDGIDGTSSGVLVSPEEDATYYFVDGELVNDNAGKYKALAAAFLSYAQMSEEERAEHAEDYALLTAAMEERAIGFTFLLQDGFKGDGTGVLPVTDAENKTSYYYFVDGELVEDSVGKYEALAASVQAYGALGKEEQTARAEEYEALRGLVAEYNQAAEELNEQQDGADDVAFAGMTVALVTASATATALAALGFVFRKKWSL